MMTAALADNPAFGKPLNDYDLPYLIALQKGIESCLLECETLSLGFDTLRVSTDAFYSFHPETRASLSFHVTRSNRTSYGARVSCRHKPYARLLLARAGIPIAPGGVFTRRQMPAAREFSRTVGMPVVVKPTIGSGGDRVVTNIADTSALDEAVLSTIQEGETFLVEKHVEGFDYRFQVLSKEVVAVHWRQPAHVVGDGLSTIRQLVDAKNLLRGRNPHLATRLISLNAETQNRLRALGLRSTDVPSRGQVVTLKTVCNLSQGGDNVDVTDETHPTLKAVAVAALAAIPGIEHGGVDALLANHEEPLEAQELHIIEINACPGMSAHHFPVSGSPRNVARPTVRRHAELQGVPLVERDRIRVRFLLSGSLDAAREMSAINDAARTASADCNLYQMNDAILGTMRGRPLQVAATISAAAQMRGGGVLHQIQAQCVPE
jgi:D-alanine-D-alanine ligase-like ATP-grasp enzyme